MDRYGIDKPDTRYGMKIVDLGDVFASTPVQDLPRHPRRRRCGARHQRQGLCRHHHRPDEPPQRDRHPGGSAGEDARLHQDRERRIQDRRCGSSSPTTRRRRSSRSLNVEEGDIVFFVAGPWESACTILGRVRLEVAAMHGTDEGQRSAELPLGRRLPAARLQRRGSALGRRASSLHASEGGGHPAARSRRLRQSPRRGL